jgi:hypothetical protein
MWLAFSSQRRLSMPEFPSYTACARYLDFIRSHQSATSPAIVSPADIARATGISETDQIQIRQTLMLAGRLRLSVIGDQWAYRIEEAA